MADRKQSPRLAVVGAGVVGLSSAVCLQEAWPQAQVEIIAHKFSPNTTSDGSGGFWEPYDIPREDRDIVRKVGKTTFDHLFQLASSPLAGEVGVQLLSGYSLECGEEDQEEALLFHDIVHGLRPLSPEELARFPPEKTGEVVTSGHFFTSVQVDVTPYLQWLMKRFQAQGGIVRQEKLLSLPELAGHYDLVVNCSGLGGRELVKDREMIPARGQIWRVEAPWIKHFYLRQSKNHDTCYILPGVKNTVVGGTMQERDWRTDVDPQDSERIWENAIHYFPQLRKAKRVAEWVGLRPSRSHLRLERENMDGMAVIHNYGHRGYGVSIHWGCALEVVAMSREVLLSKAVNQTKARL